MKTLENSPEQKTSFTRMVINCILAVSWNICIMQKVFPAAVLAICCAGKISQRMQYNFGKLFFLLCLNVCIRSKRGIRNNNFKLYYPICIFYEVLIITGGYSDDPHVSRSAEVWSHDGQQCQLPSLRDDDRFLHTQVLTINYHMV